jgi:RarD protein
MSPSSAGRGFTAAISAFGIWGLFPIYLIGLRHLPAMEITAHRIVWSCVFVLAWLAVVGDLGKLADAAKRPGVLIRLVGSAFFIAVNWVGFAWAVNNGHVLEVSLAYFIGPLLNILLGIFVLRERLNGTQWLAVTFAAAGVLYLTFIAGHPPWIALMVGSSFAFYGLIRKTVNIDALPGLAVETILLAPFAAAYLVWCELNGAAAFGHDTGPGEYAVARGWRGHLGAAGAVRVRRAPGALLDHRRDPVPRAQPAAALRPGGLWRVAGRRARHRLRADLDRPAHIYSECAVAGACPGRRRDLTISVGNLPQNKINRSGMVQWYVSMMQTMTPSDFARSPPCP